MIVHELTHVAQQSAGLVSSPASGMTVNAPGDSFEQEAASVAKSLSAPGAAAQAAPFAQRHERNAQAQRQAIPEVEEPIQTQVEPEEEE